MLINAGSFLSHLDLDRTVAVTGEPGVGKDLLCFELAEQKLRAGYRFITNQNSVWSDPVWQKQYLTEDEVRIVRAGYGVAGGKAERGVEVTNNDGVIYAKPVGKVREGDKVRMIEKQNWFEHMMLGAELHTQMYCEAMQEEEAWELMTWYAEDDGGWFMRVPCVRHSVMIASEAGEHLREWKYFGRLKLLQRKLDTFLMLPSVRLPHVDLCELTVKSVLPFSTLFGTNGGFWYWMKSGQGIANPYGGWFLHLPGEVGVYDTKDVSFAPTEVIDWFKRQVEYIQRTEYKRDRLQTLGAPAEAIETDALATLARRFEKAGLSLPFEH